VLTDNLPLLAGAPNGIKKLRELILELAVRGLLDTQDPRDESSELILAASRAVRSKAMVEGLIKKEKPASPINEEDKPFSLPVGWAWCRIVDTGDYINGLAFKPSDWSREGKPIIRIQNLSGRNPDFNRTDRSVDRSVIVNPGDILVSWSATLDAFLWNGEQGVLNQHIFRVSPAPIVDKSYLYWLLKWAIRVLADSDHSHGLVMAHINRGPFLAQTVGLPPLAEQHRIVAKVDELMALCDTLEAQQADAESAHARLVQALLDSLIQASDAQDFATHWQRLSTHFDTLFTTESSIDALKQTLLQLAVMGKLVPQDESDGSASEMLNAIADEKRKLEAEGRFKNVRHAKYIPEREAFDLPENWSWAGADDLTLLITDGTHHTPTYIAHGVPFISVKDIDGKTVSFDHCKYISEEEHTAINTRCNPEQGDILLCRIGTLGRPTIVDTATAFSVFVSVGLLKLPKTLDLSRYLHLALSSPLLYRQFDQIKAGGSHTSKLNLGDIPRLRIPLPPTAEQHRIVAKVDQLMAICDQLKTRLRQARDLNQQLATTLVERAVA
jgi:type I restriction enzyme S subunit